MPVDPSDSGTDNNSVDTTAGSNHDFFRFPVLEIDGEIPSDGDTTAQFVMAGNVEVTESVNPNPLLEGVLGQTNALFTQFGEALSDIGQDDALAQRRAIWFDLGAGEHTIEFDFIGWDGANVDLDGDGNVENLKWGSVDSSISGLPADATGEDATAQMMTLHRYLGTTTMGSFTHGRLYYGHFAPDNAGPNNDQGAFNEDYLPVAVQSSTGVRSFEENDLFDGSLECIAVQQISEEIDALIETFI